MDLKQYCIFCQDRITKLNRNSGIPSPLIPDLNTLCHYLGIKFPWQRQNYKAEEDSLGHERHQIFDQLSPYFNGAKKICFIENKLCDYRYPKLCANCFEKVDGVAKLVEELKEIERRIEEGSRQIQNIILFGGGGGIFENEVPGSSSLEYKTDHKYPEVVQLLKRLVQKSLPEGTSSSRLTNNSGHQPPSQIGRETLDVIYKTEEEGAEFTEQNQSELVEVDVKPEVDSYLEEEEEEEEEEESCVDPRIHNFINENDEEEEEDYDVGGNYSSDFFVQEGSSNSGRASDNEDYGNDWSNDNSNSSNQGQDRGGKRRKYQRSTQPRHKSTLNRMCASCDLQFSTASELLAHNKILHDTGPSPSTSATWKTASGSPSSSFASTSASAFEGPLPCPLCPGKVFKNASTLNNHHKIFHSDGDSKRFKCPHCDKGFVHNVTLRHHVEQIHEKIRYYCDLCPKNFTSNRFLKEHRDLHIEGGGPAVVICPICQGQYSCKSALKTHIKSVHQKQEPSPCEICGKVFPSVYCLRAHRSSVHKIKKRDMQGNSVQPEVGANQGKGVPVVNELVECSKCSRKYANEKMLTRHFRKDHLWKERQMELQNQNRDDFEDEEI